MTTRNTFEHELKNLRESLENMAKRIEYGIDCLSECIEKKDMEIAKNIIDKDSIVNDMERDIEAKCLAIITRQQPVAKDLRIVSTALKVVTDMERIGDNTADIAELLMRCQNVELSAYSEHIPGMIGVTKEMVHNGVQAFLERDSEQAKIIIKQDDVVDNLFNKVKHEIIVCLQNTEHNEDHCIDVLMIAKYLERIGDHAVNICEWGLFQETGTIDNVRIM